MKKVAVVVSVVFCVFGQEASAQWWGPLVAKRGNAAIRGSLQVNNPQAYKAWLAAQRSVPQNFYRGGNPYGRYAAPYGYPRARDPWRQAYQADLAWKRSFPPNGGKQRQQPRPPQGGNPEMPPWPPDPGVNSPDSPAGGYEPLREEDGKVISRPPVPTTNQPLLLPF